MFFRALFTWIPYLLEDVLLENIWKKIFILPVVLTAFFYWLIPADPRNLILFRARAIGIVLVSILPLVICGVFYIAWWMERKNRENTKTQQENEMLEEELFNDYKAVMKLYSFQGKLDLLDEYTQLLIDHTALLPEDKGYIEKIQIAVQLEIHSDELNSINQKYIEEL